ncbi:hypothetical protein LCGC14_0844710 [marine sediment metagenome]|uniref:Uncharacterized protein n=1 Tax=marine sediment metagenome TaxID=412755 RepID=A0A0F9PXB8_9ZZZZ
MKDVLLIISAGAIVGFLFGIVCLLNKIIALMQ